MQRNAHPAPHTKIGTDPSDKAKAVTGEALQGALVDLARSAADTVAERASAIGVSRDGRGYGGQGVRDRFFPDRLHR